MGSPTSSPTLRPRVPSGTADVPPPLKPADANDSPRSRGAGLVVGTGLGEPDAAPVVAADPLQQAALHEAPRSPDLERRSATRPTEVEAGAGPDVPVANDVSGPKPPKPPKPAKPARHKATAAVDAAPASRPADSMQPHLPASASTTDLPHGAAIQTEIVGKPIPAQAFDAFLQGLDRFEEHPTPEGAAALVGAHVAKWAPALQQMRDALRQALDEAGDDPAKLKGAFRPLRKIAVIAVARDTLKDELYKFREDPAESMVSTLLARADACVPQPYPAAYAACRKAVRDALTRSKKDALEAWQKNPQLPRVPPLGLEQVKDLCGLCELALRQGDEPAGPRPESKQDTLNSPRSMEPGAGGEGKEHRRAGSVGASRRGSGLLPPKRASLFGVHDPVNARFERAVGAPGSPGFTEALRSARGTQAEKDFNFLMAVDFFLKHPTPEGAAALMQVFIDDGAPSLLGFVNVETRLELATTLPAATSAERLRDVFRPLRATVQQGILQAGLYSMPETKAAGRPAHATPDAEFAEFSKRLAHPHWCGELKEFAQKYMFLENVMFMLLFARFFDKATTDDERGVLFEQLHRTHIAPVPCALSFEFGASREAILKEVKHEAAARAQGQAPAPLGLESALAKALWKLGVEHVKGYIDAQIQEHGFAYTDPQAASPREGHRGSSIGRKFGSLRPARRESLGPLPDKFADVPVGSGWFNLVRAYAKDAHAETDVEFVEEAHKFNVAAAPNAATARTLRDQFIREGAPKQTNLAAPVRLAVERAYQTGLSTGDYAEFKIELAKARDVVVGLVDTNQYKAFKVRPETKALLQVEAGRK